MPLAERERLGGLDVMEVRERAGREHLEIDVRLVHFRKPQLGVGERASRVLHADQLVVADPVPGPAAVIGPELGAVAARGTVRGLQAHVRVNIDDGGVGNARHAFVSLARSVSAD